MGTLWAVGAVGGGERTQLYSLVGQYVWFFCYTALLNVPSHSMKIYIKYLHKNLSKEPFHQLSTFEPFVSVVMILKAMQ